MFMLTLCVLVLLKSWCSHSPSPSYVSEIPSSQPSSHMYKVMLQNHRRYAEADHQTYRTAFAVLCVPSLFQKSSCPIACAVLCHLSFPLNSLLACSANVDLCTLLGTCLSPSAFKRLSYFIAMLLSPSAFSVKMHQP